MLKTNPREMKNPVYDAPLLTNLSTFPSSPKWTLTRPRTAPTKLRISETREAGSQLDSLPCIENTSKFRRVASACRFGTSTRFTHEGGMRSCTSSQPGPGQYHHVGDYSASPYHSICNITFGKGERLFPKYFHGRAASNPAPDKYDIRGKYRQGGFTFDQKGVNVNHRHGWYYDAEVRASRNKPGPGAYNPSYPAEKSDRHFSFGLGDRPAVHIVTAIGVPAPGQYELKSTLGGRRFSFTTTRSSFGSIHDQHKDCPKLGPVCSQPTQFGGR